MRLTLRNNFHHSEVDLSIKGLSKPLSPSQVKKARRALCPRDCTCPDTAAGTLGPQYLHAVRVTLIDMQDGSVMVTRWDDLPF